VQALVFDEWVVSDGTLTSAFSTSSVSYNIDGGSTQTVPIKNLIDNNAFTLGSITRNDGYIYFTVPFAVSAGQIVTFLAQTLTFDSVDPNFKQPPAIFTGNAYLVNLSTAGAVSGLTSVNPIPEPSAALFGVAGTLGLLRRRR
jgi:hypothetical protein